MQAVITADIVNSTKLGVAKERKLLNRINSLLSAYQYEFYRGDSFQVFLPDATEALKTALLCRTAAVCIGEAEAETESDVRISIGVGAARTPAKTLSTAKGEAFVLSGRAFDEISKTTQRLIIAAAHPLGNEGLQVIAGYINAIFRGMTAKQATVIYELLLGQTQQVVAKKLKRSKSTISQHVSSGRWSEIETLLQQYANIIRILAS
jgi:hypothetical protein